MAKIIDEKTCMLRLDAAGRTENNRWKHITNEIQHGRHIPGQTLEKWFKRRTIKTDDFAGEISREQHLLIKAAYGMLQVGCIATDGNRVGVFLRREKEKPTGVEKITSGFSILRCWSPHGTSLKEIQSDFLRRTGFRGGAQLDIAPFGLGFNEVLEGPRNMGSGYFFMIYKAVCAAGDFPAGEYGATGTKSGETFIGFFDPKALHEGSACHEEEVIRFEGRMDNLVLRSMADGERSVHSGVLGTFNQEVWVSGDAMTFGVANSDDETRRFGMWLVEMSRKYGVGMVQSAIYDILKFGVVYSAFQAFRP